MAGRARDRPRRPHRHPDAVGQLRALRRDPLGAGHRRRLRPGRRRRSRRSGPSWCSARPASSRSSPSRGWSAALARRAAGARASHCIRDDAWIIFTSGSTGTPKGVAVTHRNAAAFVDAEARIFLLDNPIGPGDRVLAGLSVAFDASCEEMWLAWRYGACLVPAPRSLVRSGMDLGPWLVSRDITVVSTVPTLAALWPAEALEAVRLLIFGGEACPPELAERLAGRRAARCGTPTAPPRRPWWRAWPSSTGRARSASACRCRAGTSRSSTRTATRSPLGEVGELVIGGVGLARYLDPDKDAEKYAPMPTLEWSRAYRSGDLVRLESDGLYFQGRADDQVKVGGRRIELGEVDSALVNLPGVSGGAAAVRRTAERHSPAGRLHRERRPRVRPGGRPRSAGRVAARGAGARASSCSTNCRPGPRARSTATRCRGPSPAADDADDPDLGGTTGWLAGLWRDVLAAPVDGPEEDFFALGGGSLSAAQLVAALRARYPEVTVADLYDHPRLGSLAGYLDELDPPPAVETRVGHSRSPRLTELAQVVAVGAAGHADRACSGWCGWRC